MLFLYLGIEVTRIFFVWTHTENISELCFMELCALHKGERSCIHLPFQWLPVAGPRRGMGIQFLGQTERRLSCHAGRGPLVGFPVFGKSFHVMTGPNTYCTPALYSSWRMTVDPFQLCTLGH
ncbi:transmembrane protein 216 isoform X3 [Rhineura floridana]|nr:transmembrane protein 216 isoform X3 [Rhineura floridana]XP_061465784.1 transmembrane protein 216 isoform X3 [Rhineura floridana]